MDATTTVAAPTATPDLGAPNPIVLTSKAIEMVKDAIQREGLTGYGIRVGVMGGGCAGFQYSMDFEKEPKDGDLSFVQDGITLFVDPMSSMYLQGVSVDYVQGLQGAGFKFVNPNARSTCGCGSSFSY
ncbi:MAG TPA: iron-sulfur cluster insertion protein ErpA [Anaeromyxobacteraceae bacterium]|nr:iron-sulfur cluster insertion protein ErpA [Anaeromyxobacteraceae bacterium]